MRAARRAVAFVIHHAYCDALACYREPMRYFADAGWQVDLYIGISAQHAAPSFPQAGVRLYPVEVSPAGALRLVGQLVRRSQRYAAMFCAPGWAVHWAAQVAMLTGVPLGYISDELVADEELTTPALHKWMQRERAAHRHCAFTIALSLERAAYLRHLHDLPEQHPIFVVPNAAPGPAVRQPSRYYRDRLALSDDRTIALHAGGMGWAPLASLITEAEQWQDPDAPALVCQGRLPSQMAACVARGAAYYASDSLPSAILDYAVSSADVGLALYDDGKVNDRLMGTASGKVCLYLKSGLPVVTTRQSCFEWIETAGCGVRAGSVREIRPAIEAARADFRRLSAGARRYYAEHLDFRRTFAPVVAMVEDLATGWSTARRVARRATVAPAGEA